MPPCLLIFPPNKLVWDLILAWHLWHAVLLPAVKSVCLLGLPAKNVPLCKHTCHIPSPLHPLLWHGVPIPHAWSFASHYPVWSKLCVWCTSLISVSKMIMSKRRLHIVVCVQVSLLCQWGLRHLLHHWLRCLNSSSAGCHQDVAGWVCWWSFLVSAQTPSPFQNLPFTWVFSLTFHTSNALFENCLTVQLRATLCIQTDMQAFRHKTTCAEFRTQADTDITMHTPWNNEYWDSKLRDICSMALYLRQYSQQGHLMRPSQRPPPAFLPHHPMFNQ